MNGMHRIVLTIMILAAAGSWGLVFWAAGDIGK